MALGPVVLDTIGQSYTLPCRIASILWVGTTTAGDIALLRHRTSNEELWKGQTDATNTYLGMNFSPKGHHCPNGFTVAQLSSGKVYVYLVEQ
jgi:hypothetical protein